MYVRLGFAVAIHTDPEILLVDEVLAVGDEAFAHRCLRRIEELLAAGRTVVFVSHSLALVEELCSRVLWLDDGRVRLIGDPRRVVDAYRQAVAEDEGRAHREAKEEREREEDGAARRRGRVRGGSGGGTALGLAAPRRSLGVRLLDGERRRALPLRERRGGHLRDRGAGRAAARRLRLRRRAVSTPRGVEVWGTNTDLDGFESGAASGRAKRAPLESARACASRPASTWSTSPSTRRTGRPTTTVASCWRSPSPAPLAASGVYLPEHRWQFAGSKDAASAGSELSFERSRHE